jgi:hypothetical protein
MAGEEKKEISLGVSSIRYVIIAEHPQVSE